MANSLGSTSTGILAQRALMLVVQSLMLRLFATDLEQLSPELPRAAKDENIKFKIPTPPTVGDFGDAATDLGTTEVTATLGYWKQVRNALTAAELQAISVAHVNPRAMLVLDHRARLMSQQLIRDVVSRLIGVFTVANGYTALAAAAQADHDHDYFVDVRAALNAPTLYCPDFARWALVNSATYAVLLKDDRVIKTHKEAASGLDPQETGYIANVAGFNVFEVPYLNTANGTANLTGIYGVPSAAVYGSRHPLDPASLFPDAPQDAFNEELIDPEFGLRMLNQEKISNYNLTAEMRTSILYGVSKGIVGHALLGVKS